MKKLLQLSAIVIGVFCLIILASEPTENNRGIANEILDKVLAFAGFGFSCLLYYIGEKIIVVNEDGKKNFYLELRF